MLAIDAFTAEVVERLDAVGVGSLVLKGPTLSQWLYGDGSRSYEDCDLLVDPARREQAERALRSLGFSPYEPPSVASGLVPLPSSSWLRGWERVDLHRSFWGLAADPSAVWGALTEGAEQQLVARRPVRVPGEGPRLLLVALHAVHHGRRNRQPVEDLRRALERGSPAAWTDALRLARRLGGEAAFVAAFELLPGGVDRATALGIPRRRTIESAVAAAGLPVSEGFERLAQTTTTRDRLRLVRAELAPTPEFMRWRYRQARSGPAGLAGAYLLRLGSLGASGARGVWAWLVLHRLRR